jgi:TonB-dependent receptor
MKKLLLSAALGAMASGLAPLAWADEKPATTEAPSGGESTELAEVTVVGIRKSIADSINVKREIDVVSDTISAEDVGQFPDINLAESLQRITGVQITRLSPDGTSANEGQYVSVRGLPTEFNYVSLNGESAASASNNLTNETSDRNFNFSVLSPDFISALEVYKSPKADLTEGGVAAVINVKTLLPFDIGKQIFKASVEGQSSSQEDTPTQNLSAIYSNVFFDNQFGLTVGAAWNKRKYLNTSVTDSQLDPQTINGKNYYVLDSLGVTETQNLYDTKSGYAALQYRPVSDLTFTLIGLHTITDNNEMQPAFTLRPQYASSYSSLVADPNNVLTTQVGTNSYYEVQNFTTWNTDSLNHLTLKEDWNVGNFTLDSSVGISDSKTTSAQIGMDTLESGRFGIGPAYSGGYTMSPGDTIPSFIVDPAFNPNDPKNYFVNYIGGNTLVRDDVIRSASLDGTYHVPSGVIKAVKIGTRFEEETNTNANKFDEDTSLGHSSAAPYITGSLLPFPSLYGYGGSSFVPLNYAFVNPQTYLNSFFGGSYNNWLNAPTTKSGVSTGTNASNQYAVVEKDTGAYAMADYKFDWQVPVHGNFGVRFVHTEEAVTDTAVDLADITFIEPPPPPPAPGAIVPPGSQYTLSRSYNDVLPSFNLIADLREDLLLRFAVAKVMSRPTLDYLVPRYSVSVGTSDSVTGGNPNLDPFRAWQYDLSLEWYFHTGSLLSADLFYKSVKDFIQIQHQPLVLGGITFDETVPVNTAGGYVEGTEVGYTQLFTQLPSFLSGLGTQINATWAQGIEDADPAANLPAHEFQNLSRWTANASIFYAAYGVNTRLAYNYRSQYLYDPDLRGLGNTRVYGKSFATLDFQASYAITNYLTAFVEGTNLTREAQTFVMQVSGASQVQNYYPQTWIEGDRRLGAGFRVSF